MSDKLDILIETIEEQIERIKNEENIELIENNNDMLDLLHSGSTLVIVRMFSNRMIIICNILFKCFTNT